MYKKTENVSALGIGFQREEYHDSSKISIVWRIHGETGFATDSEPHIQLEELYQKTFNKPVETTNEQPINLKLSQEEAKALLHCLKRTSAKGNELTISMMIEDKLSDWLKV